MKYAQFAELCDREWLAESPPYGNVTALSLTDESLAELSAEATAGVDREALRRSGFTPPEEVILVAEALNPVTRFAVKVTGGAEADTATVSYGTAAWAPEPRTVAITPGALAAP